MGPEAVLFATILVFILENCYACSQVFTAKSGVIESPKDANNNYPNNANCAYTIIGGSNGHYVHFRFESFGLETQFDFLYVGNDILTGDKTRYSKAYYYDNTIILRFTSDGSRNTAGGFRIRYRIIEDTHSRIYRGKTGTISSPKNTTTKHYPDNARYIYIIRSVFSDIRIVQITFETFHLEQKFDYLYIGNQNFTGNKTGFKADYDFDNDLMLVFTSDSSQHSYAGFTINYRMIADCNDGHYGPTCTLRCSSGCSDVCHKVTGRCNCKVGWTGEKCNAACPSGTYDSYCTKTCSPGCEDGSCNKLDGSCSCKSGYTGSRCTSQCYDGYYGVNCTSRCSSGCLSVCNKETGTCTCKTGWTGIKCNAGKLRSNRKNATYRRNIELVNQSCSSGTYGSYCAKSCSPGCVDGTCNKLDGSCSCQPGYSGKWCKQKCSNGYYGLNCTSGCSSGCHGVCNKETGTCTCKTGWTGIRCETACPSGMYDSYCAKSCSPGCVDGSCNKLDGSCSCQPGYTGKWCKQKCGDGYYGLNCSSRCSSGCLSVCNKETGTCTCKSGWTGKNCNTACPTGTYDSYCRKSCSPGCVEGSCKNEGESCSCRWGYTGAGCKDYCSDGYYGLNCTSRCSPGCLDVCNKETGTCSCKTGWTGKHCETACPSGTYDSYCTKTCSPRCVNGSCNQENGTCSYKPEYTGDNNDNGTFDMKLIAGVTGGSVGFALLVTAFLVICCCFRRKRARNEATKSPKGWNEMKNLYLKDDKATASRDEAIYDLTIKEDLGKTDLYESLKYSGGQKSGTSQPVSLSGDAEKDTEYVNFQTQKKVKSGGNQRQQCYENHAIQSGGSEM